MFVIPILRTQRCIKCASLLRLCSISNKESYIEKLRKGFEQDEKKNLLVPVFKRAMLFPDQIAIKDIAGEYSYFQLYMSAKKLSFQISNICGGASLSHVTYLCPNNVLWIIIQWACWISGQVAVPLQPINSIEYFKRIVKDCKSKLIITTPEYESTAQNLSTDCNNAFLIVDYSFVPSVDSISSTFSKQIISTDGSILTESTLPNNFYAKEKAMVVYTAGSIGTQKAVILTYRNIEAQMKCLINSWKLNSLDSLMHLIPLNRIQTVVNSLLSVGGHVVLHQHFDCHNAWSAILGINNPSKQRINIFLATPITYKRLITEYDKIFAKDSRMVEYIVNHCKSQFRLMASTFAPLPDSVFNRWRNITGQNLLEYYGMVETGFVLGNPPLENRDNADYCPGTVGSPLVGVNARLVSNENSEVINFNPNVNFVTVENNKSSKQPTNDNSSPVSKNIVGELQLAGDYVFYDYLNQDKGDSCKNKFFKTSDIFAYQNSSFKFLGKYKDIITVGGYKIYSSEIKKVLLTHPTVKDVAVLGIPNKIWGQRLGVICILGTDVELDLKSIQSFCNSQLPTYKQPTILKIIAK